MKKFLLFSAAGMCLAASLSGCTFEGDNITKKSIEFPLILRDDWQVVTPQRGNGNAIGSYFVCKLPLPEISGYKFDRGVITCYYRYVDDEDYTVQTPLPYTYYMADEEYPHRYQYELTYSFEISLDEKVILFKVYVSDFYTGESRKYLPDESEFHLVMMY